MALKITHTCEWCNKLVECETVALPQGWIKAEVHDPKTFLSRAGGFCEETCRKLYKDNEPDAIESARQHYTNEYYSHMNKMKAYANEVSKH
jgi:hypothetical protein